MLARMASTLALVVLLWSVSSWGCYVLVDALALDVGYDEAPILFAAYYLGWTAVATFLFRGVMAGRFCGRAC